MCEECFEAIGVPEEPVDHVAAVGCAGGAEMRAVDVRKRGEHIDAVHDVRNDFAAPVTGDFFDELLSESG